MTEYELLDNWINLSELITSEQVLYLSGISAYLIVAFTVGKKLTRFQVSFINIILFFFFLSDLNATLHHLSLIIDISKQLGVAAPDSIFSTEATGSEKFVVTGFFLTKVLMGIGCYVFMWQVRHGKE